MRSVFVSVFGLLILVGFDSFAQAPNSCFVDTTGKISKVDDSRINGVNGSYCRGSKYNCKLRSSGGQEVRRERPQSSTYRDTHWEVSRDCHVRDGNGKAMIKNDRSRMSFNFGLKRWFYGNDYGYARSTSNSSSGWYPVKCLKHAAEYRRQAWPNGYILAKSTGKKKLGCYEIKSTANKDFSELKVVYNSDSRHEKAGDYLPKVRKNGKSSTNLAFNVPGCGLGAPAIDHFEAGTKFQRVDVPTVTNRPSLDIYLYKADRNGYGTRDRASETMKFIYGYIVSNYNGVKKKRYGWMAHKALKVSNGCE